MWRTSSAFGASTDSNLLRQRRQPHGCLLSPIESFCQGRCDLLPSSAQTQGETHTEVTAGLCPPRKSSCLPGTEFLQTSLCPQLSIINSFKTYDFTCIVSSLVATVRKIIGRNLVCVLTGNGTPTEHCKHIKYFLNAASTNELLALSNHKFNCSEYIPQNISKRHTSC